MELTFPKKPYRTHGGADVPHHKNTAQMETAVMPCPSQVTIPMQQTCGAPPANQVLRGGSLGSKLTLAIRN